MNYAHLKPESPIVNILLPNLVLLEKCDETEAFMLDWTKCTDGQRQQIADLVTKLRGGTPSEFLAYMAGGGGMPIRVSQTAGTSTDVPFFL